MAIQLHKPERGRSLVLSSASWYDTHELSRPDGRGVNMDALGHFVAPSGVGVWVVADGLGGHVGSEVASRLAVDTILECFRNDPVFGREAIADLFTAANTAVLNARASNPALAEIATTLVVLLSDGKHVIWGHVGDSRLYACGGDRFWTTADHRNASRELVRAVPSRDLVPDLSAETDLCRDDALLLCVDGFWEKLLDVEIEVDYAKSKNATDWIRYLDWRIRGRRGGEGDSVTAVAVRPLHPELPALPSLPVEPLIPRRSSYLSKFLTEAAKVSSFASIGLGTILLIAVGIGIFKVQKYYTIRTLVVSISRHSQAAENYAEQARQASENAKSAAKSARESVSTADGASALGRAEEANKKARVADSQASEAAKAASREATLATYDMKALGENSRGKEDALSDEKHAIDMAEAADRSAREALTAANEAQAATNTALALNWVNDARRLLDKAGAEATKAKFLAAEAAKISSNKSDPNANLVDQRAAEAEKAAKAAQDAAGEALGKYEQLKSAPFLVKPSWIADTKDLSDRSKEESRKADEAARAARAGADLALFRTWANDATDKSGKAQTEARNAAQALKDVTRALSAVRVAVNKRSWNQAQLQASQAEQNAGDAETAAKAAEVYLENVRTAQKCLTNRTQSTSNPQAKETLTQTQNAVESALTAATQAQQAATQARMFAKEARVAATPAPPVRTENAQDPATSATGVPDSRLAPPQIGK